jgi:hypothetical protein
MSESWSVERAIRWQSERGWRVGCNFVPSTATNQLEMWQAGTYDLETIERELALAGGLGFTSLRVFLHDLAWQQDPRGFGDRVERFLDAAHGHGLGVLPVLFDGVWNPNPRPGPQPDPRPRVHNSGWVQGPGADVLADPSRLDSLEPYVTGLLDRFGRDPRIDGWDLFNEPDNPNPAYAKQEVPDKAARAGELLRRTFDWARSADPTQPLTVGVWHGDWSDAEKLSDVARLSLERSDVISFHCYGPLDELRSRVESLARYRRPILCTEFMARSLGSTFDPQLVWMKEHGVGAYCWGLVAGRTQTEYPWDSWVRAYDEAPDPWFHDVLRPDGSPFDPEEVALIRRLTGAGAPA